MAEDSRIQVAQEFFQRYFSGDVARASELLDDQVVYRVPGLRKPAGVFVGAEAVVRHIRNFLALLESPVDVLKWEDWMAGADYVAGLASIHLQREGVNIEPRLVWVVTVAKGKIREIEIFYNDEPAIDRLFADEA
jgi:ketosteroid isomerase-like protein